MGATAAVCRNDDDPKFHDQQASHAGGHNHGNPVSDQKCPRPVSMVVGTTPQNVVTRSLCVNVLETARRKRMAVGASSHGCWVQLEHMQHLGCRVIGLNVVWEER